VSGSQPVLAVVTMQLGAVSETFIRKHIDGLLPGRTVSIARISTAGWVPTTPAFLEDRWRLGLGVRLAARAGSEVARMRDRAVAAFLKKHAVTVVLGEYMDQFLDFVPLLDRVGLPYVVQAHGIDVSASLTDPEMRRRYLAYRSARAVLTRCEFHRRRLIDLGLPADIIHVNPGGVDVPQIAPEHDADAGYRFLAVGRMCPQKAPIMLLEAFRQAAAREPRLTLDYVGGGPLFPAVDQFVRACGLQDRVTLHGVAPEPVKMDLLRRCGVFVQHSALDTQTGDEEGLPAAIQEAMGHGLAVVSTRHSGIPEAVIEGETGLLVDENDAAGMGEAFVRVPPLATTLGRAGHARALDHYTWPHERARLARWLFNEGVET